MTKKKIRNFEVWENFKLETDPDERQKLKNDIVELYLPFVIDLAEKMERKLNHHLSTEELTSFGIDGLYIAIDKFDIYREIEFKTYSNRRIKGSMIDNIRKEDIIPRSVRINNNIIEKARSKIESEKGRKAYQNELLEEIGVKEQDFLVHNKKYNPAIFSSLNGIKTSENSNNEEFSQDSNSNLIDKDSILPDNELRRKEFFNKLMGRNFSRIEQKIIYYYYYEKLTMEQIAKTLKLSESRVSQMHKSLLPRLKQKIERNPEYFSNDIFSFINSCDKRQSLFK